MLSKWAIICLVWLITFTGSSYASRFWPRFFTHGFGSLSRWAIPCGNWKARIAINNTLIVQASFSRFIMAPGENES